MRFGCFVSVLSAAGEILLYGDAVAHINIARRVFDSRTPGLAAIGDGLAAASAPADDAVGGFEVDVADGRRRIDSVDGGVCVGRGRDLPAGAGRASDSAAGSSSRVSAPAWLAATIYGLNPNLLYLQATAMTESLYLALFVWAVVYFNEFVQGIAIGTAGVLRAKRSLGNAGCVWRARALTRYDGWFLAATAAGDWCW